MESGRAVIGRSTEGARLIIVCGLPGAGKTTHARLLEPALNAIRLSPDEWMTALDVSLHNEAFRDRVEKQQWTLGKQMLVRGLTVIIEWGTWGRWERDHLRTGARILGAAVELHYLTASPEVLWERIQKRGIEDPPIKREVLARWIELFEAPQEDEIALFDRFVCIEGALSEGEPDGQSLQ